MYYYLVTRRGRSKREWDVHFSIHEEVLEWLGEYRAVRSVSYQLLVTLGLADTNPVRLYKMYDGQWKQVVLPVPETGPMVTGGYPSDNDVSLKRWP